MQIHELHCQEPWFSFIQSGKKIVEGRKNLPKFAQWKPGDILDFYCDGKSFRTRIIDMRRYKTLEYYLTTETLECVMPGVKTLEEGVAVYLQWSTRIEIEKYGFLAIEIQVLN